MPPVFFSYPLEISLSVSSVCNAQCIWCPVGRHLVTSSKTKFLSLSIVDKILKDMQGRNISSFVFADMGEPLLNPDFKEMVLRCKKAFPSASLTLSTNFNLMTDNMARFVLDNFASVGFNLDGISNEGYYAVKHLPVSVILDNFDNFLKRRHEKIDAMYNSGQVKGTIVTFTGDQEPSGWKPTVLNVSMVSQARYYTEIGEPEKITVADESIKVNEFLRNRLIQCYDHILETLVGTWAERRRWNKPREKSNVVCANLYAIGYKCYIDTDGNVISCCLDYDSELTFGNVMETPLPEIWDGEKRKRFISKVLSNDFAEIGLPCSICWD